MPRRERRLEGLNRSISRRATIAPTAIIAAHVVTKTEVEEEIATNDDTVTASVVPPADAPWAPPAPSTMDRFEPAGGRGRPAYPRARRWGWPFAIVGALLLAFVAIATWIPTDRYAFAPGSASAVEPRVKIDAKTYDSKGRLLFVTITQPQGERARAHRRWPGPGRRHQDRPRALRRPDAAGEPPSRT